MKDFDYRYMVYNTSKKEYQFARICEKTEKGAMTILFKLIGNDARKWRFEIKKVKSDEAKRIINAINLKQQIQNIKKYLPNLTTLEIEELINENIRRKNNAK